MKRFELMKEVYKEVEDVSKTFEGISIEKMENNDYDVLIIGSGAGGGAVLWRLCEQLKRNKMRIGIIEAGDFLYPTNFRNIEKFETKKYEKMAHHIGRNLPNFSGATQLIALGGKTLFWKGVTPRYHPEELKQWPIDISNLESYYNIAEQIMNVTQSDSKNLSKSQSILSSLRKKGFPEATHVPKAEKYVKTINKKSSSPKVFSSIDFLIGAENNRPFDLALKTRAIQLFIEKNKMFGVKVKSAQKTEHYLKAKTVVLSMGTLETPRLLLHSGIQGEAIGHYLTNHSWVQAKGKNSSNSSVTGKQSILIPQIEGKPYQIHLTAGKKNISMNGFGKVESRYENKLTLDSKKMDENGIPQIKIDFSYSERDKEIINQMCNNMNLASTALGAVLTPKDRNSPFILRPPGADHHEVGTCRMGVEPSTSATNLYGQVHFIPGLYIADNSVLPSIGAANPVLTTVALAFRTADHIIQQLD